MLPHPCQHLLPSFFYKVIAILVSKSELYVIVDLHFPNDSCCQTSFMNLSATGISSLENVQSKAFVHSLTGLCQEFS